MKGSGIEVEILLRHTQSFCEERTKDCSVLPEQMFIIDLMPTATKSFVYNVNTK